MYFKFENSTRFVELHVTEPLFIEKKKKRITAVQHAMIIVGRKIFAGNVNFAYFRWHLVKRISSLF